MKFLFILILLLPFYSYSQQYTDVIEIHGKSANTLYKQANEWFAMNFKSVKDVIQLNDPEEMKIIGKGMKPMQYPLGKMLIKMNINFTISVQFKDNRYKYDIQSNEIIPETGTQIYTYDLLKKVATEEGLLEYYKEKGIKPWVIGNKQTQINLEGNKAAVSEVEKQLHEIVDNLTAALKKDSNKETW